ncbi:MAG: ATP-binding protein [Chloroflexota bacterium]
MQIVARRTEDLDRLVSEIISHQQLKMSGLQLQNTDLISIITLAVNSARPVAEQNKLNLAIDIPQHLPMIEADPNRISQIFDNLIGNAIKFTRAGGTITVSAHVQQHTVEIDVSDTGIGIEPEALEKIFNRFFQVDGSTTRRFKGTGIGLAIVKQIVEAHQGSISVKSEIDVGTTFSFILPITQPTTEN